MNENKSSAASGGVGFCGVLTIVFIALKLTHVIDWKWVWVLAPSWISVGIGVLFLIIVFLAAVFKGDKK